MVIICIFSRSESAWDHGLSLGMDTGQGVKHFILPQIILPFLLMRNWSDR